MMSDFLGGGLGVKNDTPKIGHHLWIVPNRALSYLLHSGNSLFILSYYAQPLRLKGFSVLFLEKKNCFYYMYVSKTVKDLLFDKCPQKHDIINK